MLSQITNSSRELSSPHQCLYLYKDGRRCRARALYNEHHCFRHREDHLPPVIQNEAFEIPHLNRREAIQEALSEIDLRIARNRIDSKRADLLTYILQIASSNSASPHPPPPLA